MGKYKFLYIQYGKNDIYRRELLYSLKTLRDFHDLSRDDVFVYTDNPSAYVDIPATIVSIKDDISIYQTGGYHFRIKPCVIYRALEEINNLEQLIFLDTDTYIKSSLLNKIRMIDKKTALMNSFELKNPYPNDSLDEINLRSGKIYSYTEESVMFNSGLIGIEREHKGIFLDCIDIIDAMRMNNFKSHTIEQCALSEAFRINGFRTIPVDSEIFHYWRGTDKRYMHTQFQKGLIEGSFPFKKINHSWLKARLLKFFNNL